MTGAKVAGAPPLPMQVAVLVRELWNGEYLAFPIADPSLASYGSAEDATHELQLFLQDHLSRATADVLARFSMPPETRLLEVEVALEHEGQPRRGRPGQPVSFATIVVPFGADTWVIVPKLEHTFFVAKSDVVSPLFPPEPGRDPLVDAVRGEVKRIVAARELSSHDWLELLPPRRESLELLTVEVERAERSPEGRIATLRKKIEENKKKRDALEVLGSVARPVHERPEAKRGPDLVGRDAEVAALSALLSGRDRLGAVIVGAELVGKTAILLAWLRAEHRAGRHRLVFATSGAQLIAGMSGLGQWQERLRRVLDAAEALDAVLFFDNLGDLFGDRASGSIDLAGGIKPYLQDGRVRVLGELTPEALGVFERQHAGFFASLGRIRVEPLGAKEATRALHERLTFDAEHEPDRPTLAPEAVDTVIDLVERYLPYRPFPGKALRFYEELRSTAERTAHEGDEPPRIDTERVLAAFSAQSGIPVFLLRQDRALLAEGVIAEFERRLVGQKRAIQRVVETICVVKAQLQPAGKPLATFLFIGPTGVGKTELARTLAAFLFGSPERMVRFDMSEYADPFASERLIRGTDRSEGLLTKKVRQQPFSVLLLDEIEKAHSAVFDLLLQVSGEGRLTDARGRTAYFHNTIIIMTSNLGAVHTHRAIGIDASSRTREEHYLGEVHKAFRPEFVNRLDRIITFHELSPAEVEEVARIHCARLGQRRGFLEAGIELEIAPEALAVLAKGGYSEAYGARALRRHVEDFLVAPVARLLAKHGGEARGGRVRVLAEPKGPDEPAGLRFELVKRKGAESRRDQRDVAEIFALRRTADRWLGLERVRQLEEQVSFVLSQLSSAPEDAGKDGDRRTSQELAELQVEHHRLSELWSKTKALHQDLLTAEELALGALYEGTSAGDYVGEARRAFAALGHHLVYVLVAREAVRDQVMVLLQELDDGRGLDLWLVPLLRVLEARGWTAEVSFEHDRAPPQGTWPPSRRFGPWRAIDRALTELERAERAPKNVLLRVRGPYAGVLLALEAGLHRWIRVHPDVNPVHLAVHLVALRAELTDQEWAAGVVEPPSVDPTLDQTRVRAAREYDGVHEKLHIAGRARTLALALRDYWARFEDIALEHLLAYEAHEADRDQLFASRLDRLER